MVMGANNWLDGKNVPRLFSNIKRDFPQKPLLAVSMPGDRDIYLKMQRGFQNSGIPCYTRDEDAIASLAALHRYRQYLNSVA
jgi:acyl-CoA synthetase (NDP forming)